MECSDKKISGIVQPDTAIEYKQVLASENWNIEKEFLYM